MRSRILTALVAALLVLTTAACDDPPAPKQRLIVSIHSDMPGWGLSRGGVWSGFDYDLARWLGNELDYTVAPFDTVSQNREALLRDGVVDLVIATYSATDERWESVDFAGPYMIAYQGLMIREADRAKLSTRDTRALTICTPAGSTSETQLAENGFGRHHARATVTECMEELRAGKVDSISTDDIILYGLSAAAPGEFAVLDERIGGLEYYGIGLPKGSTDRCREISTALGDFLTSGTWDTLLTSNLPGLPAAQRAIHSPRSIQPFACGT